MLKTDFAEAYHVNQIGLILPASDVELWKWAKVNRPLL